MKIRIYWEKDNIPWIPSPVEYGDKLYWGTGPAYPFEEWIVSEGFEEALNQGWILYYDEE